MSHLKIFLIPLFFLVLLQHPSSAQKYKPPSPAPALDIPFKNAFYVELLGNGGAYSLNYERMMVQTPNFSLNSRVGAAYFPTTFAFPVMLNSCITVSKNWSAEIGAGTRMTYRINSDIQIRGSTYSLGMRYQNKNGLLIRFAYTPFLIKENEELQLKHWLGVGVGSAF